MGLDFSHGGGCLWSYSYFNDFREAIQKEALGLPSTITPDPIELLLSHSDCEGFFEPWECGPIADRMLELVADWDRSLDSDRERAERMAKGMKRAAGLGERFLFL